MHVSRVITWSLLTLEHQTWSNDQSQHDLSWWCQFIDYLKFETRPSSLKIWVRWTPRLGRGASVFPVIIVETLSKFFFPAASMLISKTFVPKQTRETNIAGRGGKRDTCIHERTKFISWFPAVLQQLWTGLWVDVVRLTDHRVLTEFIVDVRNRTQPCIRIGLRNKVYFGSN